MCVMHRYFFEFKSSVKSQNSGLTKGKEAHVSTQPNMKAVDYVYFINLAMVWDGLCHWFRPGSYTVQYNLTLQQDRLKYTR